ncbi:MAG: hypothetical protein JW908_11900 [Anaerolineales bacterium]|nr:hypothetical protein [Anaerolineales bacterium]
MIALCYNLFLAQKDELKAYKKRWEDVETVQREESINSSFNLRWKQLNSIYRMAQGLGVIQPDLSEYGVYERWATLKEKLTIPKA